ncbi:hypothetical protein M407DRAFT_216020 [Tulasnella calospora MUT 4182]|uniref:Uncharacterized protein n=1 Tax=Tulasnella calospora MUT 4182 TaxID=1051891 RepID=A0A0C3QDD9_9AGAM|nr:hypothetical protein M407DRAFT_216020 [Tulasnella calospora MUT 4182]
MDALAELQALLEAANQKLARCTCGAFSHVSAFSLPDGSPSSSDNNTETISSLVPPNPTQDRPTPSTGLMALPVPDPMTSAPPPIQAFLLAPSPWNLSGPPPLSSVLLHPAPVSDGDVNSTVFDVCPISWPLNIPPPMVDSQTDFYGWTEAGSNVPGVPETARAAPGGRSFYPTMIPRPNAGGGVQGKHYFPKTLDDIIDAGEEGFGAAHIRWAAASMRLAVRDGDRLLQLQQGEKFRGPNFAFLTLFHSAAIICTWFAYSTGMSLAVKSVAFWYLTCKLTVVIYCEGLYLDWECYATARTTW